MAKSYRLSPLAEADLEEIWLYTAKHGSMEQADTFVAEALLYGDAGYQGVDKRPEYQGRQAKRVRSPARLRRALL